MVKAGSLFFVIVISLIIGVLSSSLLLLSYYQRIRTSQNDLTRRLALNTESGKVLLLNWQKTHLGPLDTTVDLYENGRDSVKIQQYNWGLFTVGIIKAYKGQLVNKKAFLYGPELEHNNLMALYLSDFDSPLSISGSTSIRGNASLPPAGIRKGYIEGIKYNQDTLVYGLVSQSSKNLPSINEEYLKPYFSILSSSDSENNNILKPVTSVQPLKDSISFFDPTRWIRSNEAINLAHMRLEGNICIFSSKKIVVDSTTRLKDIILISPVILIKEHFSGSIQAFASDSLTTESHCVFPYPSSLVLLKPLADDKQPFLRVGANNRLTGVILSKCKKSDINLTQIIIEASCHIQGIVYCNGYLQLVGTVSGEVLTDHFTYKTSASLYDNYLVDAHISKVELNSHFVTSGIFAQNETKNRIAKCLY